MNNKDSLEDVLLNAIQSYSNTNTTWVALSGGIDSTVLLHALVSIKDKIPNKVGAVHINHRLNQAADAWQAHCEQLCAQLNIELKVHVVSEQPSKSESIEAWARQVRYQAFSKLCADEDLVLTAQHQDDQAETLLLQLLRGAGPKGLSAMPKLMRKHNYFLARPLLSIERCEIESYAKSYQLNWIDDDSNDDTRYDRNYLRKSILPLIKQRWPAAVKTLSRSSENINEVVTLLDQKIQNDLSSINGNEVDTLKLDALTRFSYLEQKQLIRTWIENNKCILPSEAILEQIVNNVMNCEADKMPLVHWQNVDVRRYKNKLYIMLSVNQTEASETNWNITNAIALAHGTLSASLEKGKGIRDDLIQNNKVQIKYRKGGETIQPVRRNNTHELKKLFQEAEILPWARDKIPLIYINGELAAVAGFWIADKFACLPNQQGLNITWDTDLRLTA